MRTRDKKITANQLVQRLQSRLASVTANFLLSRSSYINLEKERWSKLDKECGYIEGDPTIEQYRKMFNQEGIATRIVGVLPDECWAVYPDHYETEDKRNTSYEKEFNRLVDEFDLWYELWKLDEISGIGHFGIGLIGLDDGRVLSEPVAGIDENGEKTAEFRPESREMLYFQVFDESCVQISSYNTDPNSKRFGMPQSYKIKQFTLESTSPSETNIPTELTEIDVHWHRVHHVADNCKGHKFLGNPRLRNLHKRVYDIRKILASDAEMWYKSAWPGIAFETFENLSADADFDKDSVKEEIEAYSSGMQRYIRLVGMQAKVLAQSLAEPTSHLFEHYQYIAAVIKCPVPVLLGQQTGQLASMFNSSEWNGRLSARQRLYLNPKVIHPLSRRLQLLGVLPEAKTIITSWRDLNSLSDKDKADVSLKRAQAILQYVTSGASKLIKPKHFFVLILGFTPQEADAIIKDLGGEEAITKNLKDMVDPMAGNTPSSTGTAPQRSTGAAGRRNGLGRARR